MIYTVCPSCHARTRSTERVRACAPRAQCVACNQELVWVIQPDPLTVRVEVLEEKERVTGDRLLVLIVAFLAALAFAALGRLW